MGLLEFVDGVINFVGTVAVLPAMAISDAIMLIATLFAPVSSKLIYQENLWGLPPQKKTGTLATEIISKLMIAEARHKNGII